VLVERCAADVGGEHLAEEVLREDAEGRPARQKRRERLRQRHDHRARITRLDLYAGKKVPEHGIAVEVQVLDQVDGEYDVRRRERLTILPDDAVAQLEDIGQAVGRNLRQRGEVRLDGAVGAEADEPGEDQPAQVGVGPVEAREERVHGVGYAGHAFDVGAALRGARRAGRAIRRRVRDGDEHPDAGDERQEQRPAGSIAGSHSLPDRARRAGPRAVRCSARSWRR
jgi:hypothetical protein